MHEQMKL